MSEASITVRIAAGAPEADLAAAVWPGVASVTYPHVESAHQIEQADAHITRLERLRGIRPAHVEIQPLIESTRGVTHAPEIASCSPRVRAMGLGPGITLEIGDEALDYARSECELHARAYGIVSVDPFVPHD
jgi:citrate lyase subunit beta / citryl-CoA lyase